MKNSAKKKGYDLIVVGGGHAGCEAALAAARMGLKTLLCTMLKKTIGVMSCNPAIGGIGKGQLVKEVDALGGEIGKAADYGGIQFRLLNASKGAAVHSSRAQEDRELFKNYMQKRISRQKNLWIKESKIIDVIVKNDAAMGVITKKGERVNGKSVIITAGTFMNALMHIGLKHFPGGRLGEETVSGLSKSLERLGIKLMRFKTGTCPRLDGRTIDFSKLEAQHGDKMPIPFSYSTKKISRKQVPCYITYTNEKTHDIIRAGLDRSPLYTGKIKSTGVRYCPSIEDKIMRFADRNRHQIFLEPEGLDTHEYYPNGLATSLPENVQLDFLHSITGLEHVKITKPGYGIEYDLIDPKQLHPTLEIKHIRNLFVAGQINGTTGYEEAAGQGIMAGINAALKIGSRPPVILDRSTSYLGVLIDDLVTKGTNEPYRMFTSRVEYRLMLREDNADARLREIGYKCGLVRKSEYNRTLKKRESIEDVKEYLGKKRVGRTAALDEVLKSKGLPGLNRTYTLLEMLRRPGIGFDMLYKLGLMNKPLPDEIKRSVEIEVKYAGYIRKHASEIRRFQNLEKVRIPEGLDFKNISGLSNEIREKLERARPISLGQAGRISGVTPVAISILMIHLKR